MKPRSVGKSATSRASNGGDIRSTPSPIALFLFNRPTHTERAIEALAENEEFCESPLFLFVDGPRNRADIADVERVRKIAEDVSHKYVTVIAHAENQGLARSIQSGVTRICSEFGRVIVVEDDLVVAPTYLNYMNRALERYAHTAEVMQISGFMFPVDIETDGDAFFLPFISSWGWGTWQRAWQYYSADISGWEHLLQTSSLRRQFNLENCYPYTQMLRNQSKGRIDSWAIRWYLSCFRQRGLTLYPAQTLVRNDGFDGTGTHCGAGQKAVSAMRRSPITRFPDPCVNQEVYKRVRSYLRSENSLLVRLRRRLARYQW